jgi:hypothetical protein
MELEGRSMPVTSCYLCSGDSRTCLFPGRLAHNRASACWNIVSGLVGIWRLLTYRPDVTPGRACYLLTTDTPIHYGHTICSNESRSIRRMLSKRVINSSSLCVCHVIPYYVLTRSSDSRLLLPRLSTSWIWRRWSPEHGLHPHTLPCRSLRSRSRGPSPANTTGD